jgi:hypothetical protein
MRFNVVVATHHKTGTVWMSTVFKAISKGLGATFIDFWSHYDRLDRPLRSPFVLFNHDSMFLQYSDVLAREDVRVLHLIRDPRDVLISAMHYHKISTEAWLQQPAAGQHEVGYQRKLTSFATPVEQYLFELENATNSTIEDMLDWKYDRANCFELRYEDLRRDHSMALWSRIVSFLGFEEAERVFCKDCFWTHGLFGVAANANRRHVRSGDVAQWKREFTAELALAFVERFPDALQILGYEPDDLWIERFGERSEAGRIAAD